MPSCALSLRPRARGWTECSRELDVKPRSAAGFLNSFCSFGETQGGRVAGDGARAESRRGSGKNDAWRRGDDSWVGRSVEFCDVRVDGAQGRRGFYDPAELADSALACHAARRKQRSTTYADDHLAMDKALATKALTRL